MVAHVVRKNNFLESGTDLISCSTLQRQGVDRMVEGVEGSVCAKKSLRRLRSLTAMSDTRTKTSSERPDEAFRNY